jgi:Zn-dependent peptidase ImmA (M78 family)
MPTISVKPELLRWAMARSGLSTDELSAKFPKIDAWKTGERQPTFRELEKFARTTMTPLGALFLDAPPREELPIPDFRTKDDRRLARFSPNLLDTIQTMQQRQAWLREWSIEEGAAPLDFVGSARVSMNFKSLAQQIRHRLNLDLNWAAPLANWEAAIQRLRQSMERIGIVVFSNSVVGLNNHRPLDPEEFRGFVLCDPRAPVVFLNDADAKSARIFTLAHELVHVWLGQDGVFNLERLMPAGSDIERYCNRVAAEFLIPAQQLTEQWPLARANARPFQTLAQCFKVSPLVAARRALDLNLISKPEFFRFYEQDRSAWMTRKLAQRKRGGGGDFYLTQNARLGRRFSGAVVRAAREGRILYQDAYRLTGLKGETFHRYADIVLQKMRDERG